MADTVTVEDYSKMKVADLKKALKEKGLTTSGSKSELVERLTGAVKAKDTVVPEPEPELEDPASDENVDLNETPTKPVVQSEASDDVKVEESTAEESTVPKSPEVKAAAVSSGLSEEEKLKKRVERFGVQSEDVKKLARAERFGITNSSPSSKLSTAGSGADVDVLKKRAERFGQVTSSSLSKVDEDEKIRKRKERFGGDVTAATNNTPSKFAKITFNSTPEDDKKKKRAERFGLS